MHLLTRRSAMLGATAFALATPALIRPARAAEYALRIGHVVPLTHPFHIRLQDAATAISQKSDGRVTLDTFPNSQLGGDNDLLSQARSGALDFCAPSGQILSTILPVAATTALGFIFGGYDQVWPVLDGELGAYIRGQIASKTGLVAMDRMWDLGFRQITTNSKPITGPADLAGLKIRVPVNPIAVSLFKALGASPVGINYTELYSALQTKIVDAQENPISLVQIGNFYEVQKYCSMTNHIFDGLWVSANARTWNSLPADVRELVAGELNAGALLERADLAELNSKVEADLKGKGLIFNSANTQAFREKLIAAGFYKEWRAKLGEEPFAILQKAVGPVS